MPSSEHMTLREFRDFAKRLGGNVPIFIEDHEGNRHDITDFCAERRSDGEKVIIYTSKEV